MKKHPCVRSGRFFLGLILVALMTALSSTSISQTALAADPGVWTVKAPMPTARTYQAVESINGLIYVVGGLSGTTTLNVVEVYDPVANSWSTKTAMTTGRYAAASGVINGKLYVAGGYRRENNQIFNTLEVYDPATATMCVRCVL